MCVYLCHFEPIKTQNLSAPLNDRLSLSFVENFLVVGKKMATKGRKTAVYQNHKFWRSVSMIPYAMKVLTNISK